jgi:hypothetical protein
MNLTTNATSRDRLLIVRAMFAKVVEIPFVTTLLPSLNPFSQTLKHIYLSKLSNNENSNILQKYRLVVVS